VSRGRSDDTANTEPAGTPAVFQSRCGDGSVQRSDKTGRGEISNSLERRDFIIGGIAVGALVGASTATSVAAAEGIDPHRITFHALDVCRGKPAANMRVDVSFPDGQSYRLAKTVDTTVSRRPEKLGVSGEDLKIGEYELLFHIADYYSGIGVKLPNPPLLNKVPVRFAVFEPAAYHIPLLLTPWSYSTYRGS
jgi:5-hydroxyisourate hydrolase